MKKFVLQTAILLMTGVVFITLTAIAEESLKEGKWEMTMVSKMDNLPPELANAMNQLQGQLDYHNGKMTATTPFSSSPVNLPIPKNNPAAAAQADYHMVTNNQGMTITSTSCVTNNNPIPDTKTPPGCAPPEIQRNGNTIDYHGVCHNKNFEVDSTGHITYTGNTMQGLIKTRQTVQGRNMDSTIQITGKYIGPC